MLSKEDLQNIVQQNCRTGEVVIFPNATPFALTIPTSEILSVCSALQKDERTFFDMLSCITGIDNGVAAATMEVIYTLYSIPYNHHLSLRVALPRGNPEVDSVSSVWRTADWHEREVYDMFGIQFKGHPDLRRILLPADWEGFPLRKDYTEQERYRNIKLDY